MFCHFTILGKSTREENADFFSRQKTVVENEGTYSGGEEGLLLVFFSFLFFTHIYFPASGQAVVTGVDPCSPILSRGSCLQFLWHIGFNNPTARRFFIDCCQELTLSRFPRVNLCTRKSPHEFIRVCTRGDSNSRN